MDYFLRIDEINNIEENNLDNIRPVAQYNITEEDGEILQGKFTIKNNSILCRRKKENVVEKFLYPGKLPSKFVSDELLETIEEVDTLWKNRIKLRTVENVCTFLSICDDTVNDENMKFENGEELRFDHTFNEIFKVESNESYLAIVTGGFNHDETMNSQKESRPSYLVLIKIIKKNEKKDVLMEISRTNLDETFRNLKLNKIMFNTNLASKLLLIMQNGVFVYLLTHNIINSQFSAAFLLEKELNSKCFFDRSESDGSCILRDTFYYFNHNILKDVIVIIDLWSNMVYILKASLDNCLYIYKSTLVPMELMYGASLCNNRNNEIILFCYTDMDEIIEVETEEEIFHANVHFLAYDIFTDKLYKRLSVSYLDEPPVKIFFNRTGEEIFIVKDNMLTVFVYKSQVKTLKQICQMIVLDQYSSEQLNQMDLPKNILRSD